MRKRELVTLHNSESDPSDGLEFDVDYHPRWGYHSSTDRLPRKRLRNTQFVSRDFRFRDQYDSETDDNSKSSEPNVRVEDVTDD